MLSPDLTSQAGKSLASNRTHQSRLGIFPCRSSPKGTWLWHTLDGWCVLMAMIASWDMHLDGSWWMALVVFTLWQANLVGSFTIYRGIGLATCPFIDGFPIKYCVLFIPDLPLRVYITQCITGCDVKVAARDLRDALIAEWLRLRPS